MVNFVAQKSLFVIQGPLLYLRVYKRFLEMKDVSKTWPFQVHSIIPEKHQQRFCYAALIFILCWLLFCWSTFFSESIKNRSKFLFLDFTKSCPSIQRTYDLDFLWNFLVEQEEQNEVKCILKYNDVDRKYLQKISKHSVEDLYLQLEIFDIYIYIKRWITWIYFKNNHVEKYKI